MKAADLGAEPGAEAQDRAGACERRTAGEPPLELGEVLGLLLAQPGRDLVQLRGLMVEVLVVGGIGPPRAVCGVLPQAGLVKALVAPLLLVSLLALARRGTEPVLRDVGQSPQRLHTRARRSVVSRSTAGGRSAGSGSNGTPARSWTTGSVV